MISFVVVCADGGQGDSSMRCGFCLLDAPPWADACAGNFTTSKMIAPLSAGRLGLRRRQLYETILVRRACMRGSS